MAEQPQVSTALGKDIDYGSYARNETSQSGEDGIIEALLDRLPEADRWCVEFGAWDGSVASNSATLIADGYSAVLIEGNPSKHGDLAKRYAGDETIFPICAMVGWEGPGTLDRLLAGTPIPRDFDLLSIDIDGNDFHVWDAVTKYRPKIVVIEFNPTIANGIEFVQPADPAVHQGSSISSCVSLAARKGYQLVATTEFNAFFVRDELFPAFGLSDNSVETLRTDTAWQTQIFFGFDGRAILRGGKGLYWHGLAIPDEIRMVPPGLAGFPGDFGPVRAKALHAWRGWKHVRNRFRRQP